MRVPSKFKYGLLGFGAGGLVSILFFPLNFLLAIVLLVLLLVRLSRHVAGGRINHLILGGVGCVTVAVAIAVPVKQLDARVGPFSYGRMTVDELCQALRRDHRVFVSVDRWTGTNVVGAFATERKMSRRNVLEKLAREVDCELQVGYCGTGATFLFGGHPSFTRLYAKGAQPGGAANRSQSIGAETNRTSAGGGPGG